MQAECRSIIVDQNLNRLRQAILAAAISRFLLIPSFRRHRTCGLFLFLPPACQKHLQRAVKKRRESLLADEWQQCHETSALDCSGDCVLTSSSTTTLSPAYDTALAIHHFLQ